MGSCGSSNKPSKDVLKETFGDHQQSVNCMALADDGSMLITGSEDATARLWSTKAAETECLGVLIGHSGYINAVAFCGTTAVTGSADSTIRQWDIVTCECIFVYEGHTARIQKVLVTDDYILSSSYDGTARMWLLDTFRIKEGNEASACVRVFKGHTKSVYPLIYIPNPNKDANANRKMDQSGRSFGNSRSTGSFGKSGIGLNNSQVDTHGVWDDILITGSADFTARSWNVSNGKCLRIFRDHVGAVTTMSTDSRGKILFTSGADATIKSWNIFSGQLLMSMESHTNSVLCLVVSNRLIYTGSSDGTAKCWVTEFGDCTKTYKGHKHSVICLRFYHGLLITGCGDGHVRVFDARSGTIKKTLVGHEAAVNCMALVDDKLFTGSTDATLRIWDIKDLRDDQFSGGPDTSAAATTSKHLGPACEGRGGDQCRCQRLVNDNASMLDFPEAVSVESLRNLENLDSEEQLEEVNEEGESPYAARDNTIIEVKRVFAELSAQCHSDTTKLKLIDVPEMLIPLQSDCINNGLFAIGNNIAHILTKIADFISPLPQLHPMELEGESVLCVQGQPVVYNIAETVACKPGIFFVPKTVAEVQAVVNYAAQLGKRVRVRGAGLDTWSSMMTAQDGQILISFLPPEITDPLADVRPNQSLHDLIRNWQTEFTTIKVEDPIPSSKNGRRKNAMAVKVGAGVTAAGLLRFSQKYKLALPFHLPDDASTLSGLTSVLAICTGFSSQTMSDLVVSVEFVNALGQLQVVDDRELLQTAAGALGTLGVITAVTLRMEQAVMARWRAIRIPMKEIIPERGRMDNLAVLLMENDDVHLRWFPSVTLDDELPEDGAPAMPFMWMSVRTNDGEEHEMAPVKDQVDEDFISSKDEMSINRHLHGVYMTISKHYGQTKDEATNKIWNWTTSMVTSFGNTYLPVFDVTAKPYIAATLDEVEDLIDDIAWIMPRKMEFLIPVPANPNAKNGLDLTVAQAAWNQAVRLIAEADSGRLSDVTLAARFIGTSNATLAPNRVSEEAETGFMLCMEVSAAAVVPQHEWDTLKSRLAARWSALRSAKDMADITQGNKKAADMPPLRARFNWAREISDKLALPGIGGRLTAVDFARLTYEDELVEFAEKLASICQQGGYTVSDMRRVFGNMYLDNVLDGFWPEEEDDNYGMDYENNPDK